MSTRIKYKLIAAFLLLVFSLNTVAGFACSIGMNMGYNKTHHTHGGVVPHVHTKPHVHEHKVVQQHKATDESLQAGIICVPSNDDCCTNNVADFMKLDKSVSLNTTFLASPVFLSSFTSIFLIGQTNGLQLEKKVYPFPWRWRGPDDTDIRIAIQSFQI